MSRFEYKNHSLEIWAFLLRQDAKQAARNIMVTGQQGDLLGVWDSLMKNTAF